MRRQVAPCLAGKFLMQTTAAGVLTPLGRNAWPSPARFWRSIRARPRAAPSCSGRTCAILGLGPARVRPALSRPPAGSSTTPRTSGARRSRRRGRRSPPPGSRPATSPPSASPTSARPACSGTGAPASRSTAPSSGRTGAPPTCAATLKRAGHEPMVTAKTGLLLDPYFSATKIAWLLDHVDGARALAKAGHLAFGTIDTFLLWRLTGGRVHATDATNASRTLLYDIAKGAFDDDLLRALQRAARDPAGGARLQCRLRRDRAVDPRRGRCRILRRRRRPAGGHHRPGLLRARHGQGDLRHGLLCAAQHRRQAGRLARTGCSPRSPISSTASAPTRWRARSSSPAPRCSGCATA